GLAATRFAYSPLLELRNALRLLHPLSRSNHPVYRDWRPQAVAELHGRGPDTTALFALIPPSGYCPDFLAPPPPPRGATIDVELAGVRATSADRIAAELALLEQRLSPGAGSRRRAVIRRLRADPAGVRDRIADDLAACWELLLAPVWPRVRAVLEADRESRARQLAREGAATALHGLAAGIRWRAGGLEVRRPFDEHVEVTERGLVLLPSVF